MLALVCIAVVMRYVLIGLELGGLGLTYLEVRMGKGKGSFDHWASRIAVSKVIFELKGDIHEQVARDAFRIAGNKMPGTLTRHHFLAFY